MSPYLKQSAFFLLFFFYLAANLESICFSHMLEGEAFLGSEIYYAKRTKEGNTWQNGMLYGVRTGFDHVKKSHFYWGLDLLWAQGRLNGKAKKQKIKSELSDTNLEARFGYTFQTKCWQVFSFTPYIGIGYYWEKNHYKHPSPLHLHFDNQFGYIPVGFLSQIFVMPGLTVGLNFKARFLYEGCQRVSHDPEHPSINQHYGEHPQYRAELPIIYKICMSHGLFAASLVPFWEYRHYGHRTNFPFDFYETKLNLYGATVKLIINY